jgi:8-oxo-dGTP pyrophosphatase MutT (NUDIX family)
MRVLNTRVVYENPWLRVREDAIELEGGAEGMYGVVERPDFCTVIPHQDGAFHLVEQYRHAVGARSLEFPQGALAREGDDPPTAALRELREETGLRAGRLRPLGRRLFAAAGYSNQCQHVFLATELEPGPVDREPTESDLTVVRLGVDEFENRVRTGEIVDNATLAAYTLFLLDGDG